LAGEAKKAKRNNEMTFQKDAIGYLAAIWEKQEQGLNISHQDSVLAFGDIIARYSSGEPDEHRFYHTVDHLNDLMQTADLLSFKDERSVRLAVFFHDAVYKTNIYDLMNMKAGRKPSNEEQSALYAINQLGALGYPQQTIDRVAALIRMTQNHTVDPLDEDAALFLDMDMSILGADPAQYARYAANVRGEYISVDIPTFCAGRLQFVEHTLAQNRIFITDKFEQACGAQARINLEREKSVLMVGHAYVGQRPDGFMPPQRDMP
jgi:predicted metal-dependent HD superfamily phosphohydrolase